MRTKRQREIPLESSKVMLQFPTTRIEEEKKKQEKETRSPYLDYEEQNKSIITLTKIFKGNSGIFGAHVEPYIRQIKTQKIKNNFCLKMSQQQGKFKNSE